MHAETKALPAYKNLGLSVGARVSDLCSRMTLAEKVAQLYCVGRVVEMTGVIFDDDGNLLPNKMAELFQNGVCQLGRPAQKTRPGETVKLTNAIQKFLAEETRLGIPAHTNHWLLQKILRDEWGFERFVTSDGLGVSQLVRLHHVAADLPEAARRAIEAGVDYEVPRGLCYPSLVQQVEEGAVAIETIDRAVERILRAKIRLGLLDELPHADPDEAEQITNCVAHRKLALKTARKAIVLLKNQDDVLPLDETKIESLAVIGPNAADLHLGGYAEDPQTGVTVLAGITAKVGGRVKVRYAEGCRITKGVQGFAA